MPTTIVETLTMCNGITDCLQKAMVDENLIGNIESLVKIAAILVAGYWTYRLFIQQRQGYPKATVAHLIRHAGLPDGKTLLQIGIEIRNTGAVVLQLKDINVRIQHLGPLCEDEVKSFIDAYQPFDKAAEPVIPWHLVGERQTDLTSRDAEIEPGETDTLFYDFVIPADTKVLRVYSHIRNSAKRTQWRKLRRVEREIGWGCASTYSLEEQTMIDNKKYLPEQSKPEPNPQRRDIEPPDRRQQNPEPARTPRPQQNPERPPQQRPNPSVPKKNG